VAGCYEYSNDTQGMMKCKEFLDWLNECCVIHGEGL
jgi:hypothetical protein